MSQSTTSSEFVPQVRAATLLGYRELASELGLEPYALLRGWGIRPAALDDPETRLPAAAFVGLLEDSARRSGCITFGLLLAERRSFATIGPLSLLLRHQVTVRDVLFRLIEYERLLSDVLSIGLEEHDGAATICVNLLPEVRSRQSVELAMALIRRFTSAAVGGDWRPACAYFTHSAPDELDVHRRVFGCPLRFESDFDCLVCESASLDRPNLLADAALADLARDYADRLAEALPEPSLTEQAKAGLRLLLPVGHASLARIAAHLGLNKRSLQRGLAAEGQAFGSLLDDLREELARDCLANTSLSVSEIAELLGYATATSLTRWFTARLGKSPTAWRAAHARRD